ncbi:hypothetical protein MYCTH_2113417 [Thermothelomyces thermophilus ATCC 42464]|uniref:Uncharacterized protein n=1 Tax=Thermothelomyces thermophilus (strain ATCC 42464 / BCRC 31852 / DSM 1799) TaxID=573729 RepID=G2QPJ3_THET4|nr:uncharacterized protein MYCTH_2113417 [Thermothelomyces thermophilus ATCC 42464]AEO61506.1 hypothetical protein MYCTH_2113417 [Thermothelomyces thermophilus ATCC 42464]
MGQTKENAKTDGGVGCPCYVNAAEIQQAKQSDAHECLANCRAQFLRGVLNGWEGSNGWAEGCGSLNRGVAAQEFWSLYWCDSTFCGVAIDLDGGLGQDPSVDLIINTCQNIGFYSIFNPGPPPPGFKCSTEADDMSSICSATVMSASQATPGRQPDPAVPATSASMTKLTTTTTTAQPSSTLVIQASHSESASSVATASPAPSAASTTSGTNITGQGRAAIAVCSALALMLLVCFAFVWLRRRKQRKESFDRALRSRHDHLPGAGLAGSPTPLISPVGLAVGTRGALTPPLRLRDRKFLPSILRPGSRSPSPPLTPLTPAYTPQLSGGGGGSGGNGGGGSAGVGAVSPSSPNCSLATNKVISRSEHRTGASTPRTDPADESASLLFTKAIPVPGSTSGGNNSNRGSGRSASSSSSSSSYTADGDGYGRGCGWSDGGAQAMRPPRSRLGTSTAMPSQPGTGQAPTETETGRGRHQRDATASPLPPPPPPPSRRLPLSPPYPPTPRSPSSPCRPPRPHEGMLEIPGLVTPAGSASGHGDGCGGGSSGGGSGAGGNGKGDAPGFVKVVARRFVGDGSASTPPPPLSPPPSRTLPQTPKGAGMSLPPPSPSSDGWTSPPPRLLGTPSSVPLAGNGTDMNAERSYHDHGRPPPSYPPDPGQFPPGDGAAGQSQRQPDSRESWGSWSGTGTVVGSGSCHGDSVCRNADADADADVTARAGTEVVVSRRTSKSSNATATEDTMVSAVSRTSNVGHGANTGCAESQAR